MAKKNSSQNNNQNNSRRDSKTPLIIVAFVVVAAIIIGYFWMSIHKSSYNPKDWVSGTNVTQPDDTGKKPDTPNTDDKDKHDKPNGGEITDVNSWGKVYNSDGEELDQTKIYDMPQAVTYVPLYSVQSIAQNKYLDPIVTVCASSSFEHNNIPVTWDIYDQGNNLVTSKNYVYIEESETDPMTITLRCNIAFGKNDKIEYLKLRCREFNRPSNYVECRIDYLQRLQSFNNYGFGATDFGDSEDVSATLNFSNGTIYGDITAKARFYLDTTFTDAVQALVKFDIKFKSYAATYEMTNYKNNDFCNDLETAKLLEWADFIDGFNELDKAHQQAIQYAWFNAYAKHYSKLGACMITTDLNIIQSYQGIVINRYEDFDIVPSYSRAYLTGDDGSELQPVLSLNVTNVVY